MHFTTLTLLPALAAALPTIPSSLQSIARSIVARAPPEANAVIKSATASGSGCASNSADFVFPDGAIVGFDSMIVDSTAVDKTKRCILTIDLSVDKKWKYTINKATDVRGFVQNEGGSYKVTYSAGGATSQISSNIAPTSSGNWIASSVSAGATSAYGGGVATVDVLLQLVPVAGKDSLVTIDSLDVKFDYSQ